ncbi:hypothetical protein AGOR_G00151680 [Albula goreensis]|uniref:HD domain-containing protein n=1 Tax=Albula goreensis TaxID=1534307 RepID=A0A8T3D2Q7_9TELE|nr:hypothetical protein AGOR_G00151680 [Albula goreensis]
MTETSSVQIAGLCHDLGERRTPFTLPCEHPIIPESYPYRHEQASVQMFDHLVQVNALESVMKHYGLVLPADLEFIKELINGPLDSRPQDCYHLGIQNNFDYERSLKFARVCEVEGRKHICTRDKEVDNLYNMFHTRNGLHRRAYQHKVSNAIELMITEALVKAKDYIKMSEAIKDMEAYSKLTDNVFDKILNSTDPNLTGAREILEDIHCRKLYKCVGLMYIENQLNKKTKDVRQKEVEEYLGKWPGLSKDDFKVLVVDMTYGMKDKNPIDCMHFYSKENPNKAFKIPKDRVSQLLPEKFSEQLIQVFCTKKEEQTLKEGKKCFEEWSKRQRCSPPAVPFVDNNRGELIKKLTDIQYVVNALKEKFPGKEFPSITSPEKQMEELYSFLDSEGDAVKSAFFTVLSEKEPHLVKELAVGFVDGKKEKLIKTLTHVKPLVDALEDKVQDIELPNIHYDSDSSEKQMEDLYSFLDSEVQAVKSAFYTVLSEKEPHLVRYLSWIETPQQ